MSLSIRTLLLLIFLFSFGKIKSQSFQWAKDIKSEGFDEAFDLVTDHEGNTYVAGMMEFDTDFGNNIILHSAGIHDIFLAKYNPVGKLVWAKRAGGKGGDKIQSITLDGSGHIFVTGEYEDTCYWDAIMKVTAGPGINNMFIAKYDTSGPVIWVRNISTTSPMHTRGYGITCDAVGNVYACGGTKGDTYYDGNFLFTTAGDYDGTVVKFDPNGNFCWARRMGGVESDKAYGIVSDNNSSIYVTGYFVGTADFSSNVNLTGRGHTDIFLAKYDTAGTLQWAKQVGDTGFERGHDITFNVNGQIILTGEFQTCAFGTNMAYSRGNLDMFLAAYNDNGDNIWVVSGGGVEDDIGRGVAHDTSGNIYVIGDYADSGIFPPSSIISKGFSDVFLACYDSSGSNLNWIRSMGGHENDRGRGVGIDLAGNISICGEYVDSASFGSLSLTGDTLLDIFVTHLVPGNFCSTQVSVVTQNSCAGLCNGIAIATSIGQGSINYNWSTNPFQSGTMATGLCQGTYSVTSTDANGCSSTAFVTLTDPPILQPYTTITNASCAGLCNGAVTASATGLGPFSFHWLTNPPQSDSTAIGLCQGSYTVITTDFAGCTASVVATLTDPLPLQLTASTTDASCIGCADGAIDLLVSGGTATYSYLWANGSTIEDQQNLIAGSYFVCVTDVNNCNLCDTFNIHDPSTGIIATNSYNGFSVYPNPFSSFTSLNLNIPVGEITRIVLYSTTGQVVYQAEFSGKEYRIPANFLESGIYFLQLNNKFYDRMKMIRLIVE